MKCFFIVFIIIFSFLTTAYSVEIKSCKITVNQSGGKIIKDKNNPNVGQVGFQTANRNEHISPNGHYTCDITCSGKGGVDYIDMGETAGKFLIDGFLCTWDEGKKEIDEEKTPIYSYRLVIITDETPEKLGIQVFPNPVHDCIFVRFSMPIDAKMNIKIVDEKSNVHWYSDIYVSGNEFHIDYVNFLPLGIYYIVCTNNESETVYAKFLKEK